MIFLKTAEYSTGRAYSEEKPSIYLSFPQLAVKILQDVGYDMSDNYSSVVFHAPLSLADSIPVKLILVTNLNGQPQDTYIYIYCGSY